MTTFILEYDDCYGASYGQSVEEEYSVSPTTAAQFTYGSRSRVDSSRSRNDSCSLDKTEEGDEDAIEDEEFKRSLQNLANGKLPMDATERGK